MNINLSTLNDAELEELGKSLVKERNDRKINKAKLYLARLKNLMEEMKLNNIDCVYLDRDGYACFLEPEEAYLNSDNEIVFS